MLLTILILLVVDILTHLYYIRVTKELSKPKECGCNNIKNAEVVKPIIIPNTHSRVTHLTDSYQEALRKRMSE